MDEPRWIAKKSVIHLHQLQLAEHGGEQGLVSEHSLDSALASPRDFFYYTEPKPDMASIAARYAFSLSKNHPFVDGNKRVAAIVCELFLEKNGYELNATEAECYEVFVKLARSECTVEELSAWIRLNITPSNRGNG